MDASNTHHRGRKSTKRGRRGCDRIVVGFTTTCVLDTTLCDKVCQQLATGTPVSSTYKTDRHHITGTACPGRGKSNYQNSTVILRLLSTIVDLYTYVNHTLLKTSAN